MAKRHLRMGLLLGDPCGIGPELTVKALQDPEVRALATWVLIGDERTLEQGMEIAGLDVPYQVVQGDIEEAIPEGVWLVNLRNLPQTAYTLGEMSPHVGAVIGETLEYAVGLGVRGMLDGIVYAPLNKQALQRGGFAFPDEIHLFASVMGCHTGFREVNVLDDLWVTRVTSHIPFSQIGANISRRSVEETTRFLRLLLQKTGIDNPRIAVSALNPHAGEGGLFGCEEMEVIEPVTKALRGLGWQVEGPYPADTLFVRHAAQPFDGVVSMYHDQAQIALKLLGFHRGVTVSGGLPIPLTTPAHGTAFDIAGKGIADSGAMQQAMRLATSLAGARS